MERQLTYALRQATMAMRAALRRELSELELTPPQNTALHLVDDAPGSSPAELARRAFVSAQTMHSLVTELSRRGLLTFEPRPGHGRTLEARLTERGHQLLSEANARAEAVEGRMTAGLEPQEPQQLLELLQHCTDALGIPPEKMQPDRKRRTHG